MANGSIKAQVINVRNYQPIAGMIVQLGGPGNGKKKTDAEGKFVFNNLPAGNSYTLDLSGQGWESAHYEDIVVLEDLATDLGKLAIYPEDQ